MKNFIPIRLSHLLGSCSTGAVVRGPDALMAVMDTRYWTDATGRHTGRRLRYVERIRAALGIEKDLREPPVAGQAKDGRITGVCIPALRFPGWGICPACGLLHYLPAMEGTDDNEPVRCREIDAETCQKRPALEQVSYVLIHSKGFLDDLPWHYLAHLEAKTNAQRGCSSDTTRACLRLRRASGDPSKTYLVCTRCGAGTLFSPFSFGPKIKAMRTQPWIKERAVLDEPPEIVRVNHTQVHYPKTRSALVIPPESRIRKGTVVDRLYSSTQKRKLIETAVTPLQRKSAIRSVAGELGCDASEIETAWKQIENGYPLYGKSLCITPGQLLADEYTALIGEIPDMADDEDFVTRHYTAGWKALSSEISPDRPEAGILRGIDRLIAVSRLKEILVFEGFSRCDREARLVSPDIDAKQDWLPAVELFGEGIFFSIDTGLLEAWERHPAVMERFEQVRKRFDAVFTPFRAELHRLTPRFLLLHALSHLLIRQMESDCGYPAASIRERIYCDPAGESQSRESGGKSPSMAGILVYVTVPDVVGSLGGVVELAEPRRFLSLVSSAVARADWCSADPVCAEQDGHGLYLLNRAACHCCLLIPETGCCFQNTLLDRVFVKGDAAGSMPPFFKFPAGEI